MTWIVTLTVLGPVSTEATPITKKNNNNSACNLLSLNRYGISVKLSISFLLRLGHFPLTSAQDIIAKAGRTLEASPMFRNLPFLLPEMKNVK